MTRYESLQNLAFTETPIDVSEADFQEVFKAFDDFTSLSYDVKHAGDYSIGPSNGNFGYFRKVAGSDQDGRTVSADTKHEYHFGSLTRQQFEASRFSPLPREAREFCRQAEEVYWAAVLCLRQTIADIQFGTWQNNPRPKDFDLSEHFIKERIPLNLHLRFIGYERPVNKIEPIAKGHFDRSVFTLALAESEPGLQIGFNADGSDLKPVQHTDGQAKFFLGKGWERMPQHYQDDLEGLRPAYHLVDNPDLCQTVGRSVVRHAAVFFANSLDHATDAPPEETRPQRAVALAA